MNSESIRTLAERSAEQLSDTFSGITQRQAERVIARQIANLKAEGEVFELSDEEQRLLASFRRFKATAKPGGVFKWQTRPSEIDTLIMVPAASQPILITDPQEAS